MPMTAIDGATDVELATSTSASTTPPPNPAAPPPADQPVSTGGDRPPAADTYPHLLLGNPSKATDDPKEKDNYLLKKRYFALSYNSSKGSPTGSPGG